jgi:glucokinase
MYIGIDVGGTNLKAGLVDETGRILAICRTPLGEFRGAEDFASTLARLARETAEKGGVSPERIACVGMGIPGAVKDGKIIYTCNIPMADVSIDRLFRTHFDVPVLLGNDADCAAVGEFLCGAGRGTQNFVVVTLGTGIGGGLILNRKLYTGMGMGGEIGHMVVEHDGVQCNCGRRGCWETYASATGLIRMTREAMVSAPAGMLQTVAAENGAVDGRTAFAAAERGDRQGKEVCARYVSYLADGIANVINMLHPEKIALGGGIAGAPDELLLLPLQKRVGEICYPRHGGVMTQIVRAELGNDAGIIGAALLEKAI